MCKRNSPHKNKVSTGCVRETPQIKKRSHHGMCKRNSPHKIKVFMVCVREAPEIEKKKKRKKVTEKRPTWDV